MHALAGDALDRLEIVSDHRALSGRTLNHKAAGRACKSELMHSAIVSTRMARALTANNSLIRIDVAGAEGDGGIIGADILERTVKFKK